MQGMSQLLRHLEPLVQQGNLVEQLEDVIEDKTANEVSCQPDKHIGTSVYTPPSAS